MKSFEILELLYFLYYFVNMNYKLEKFWNYLYCSFILKISSWTINLKSFEIDELKKANEEINKMNYKLEKFWNVKKFTHLGWIKIMNYKLEKFWNLTIWSNNCCLVKWTINLKSFEIKFTIFIFYIKSFNEL